MTRIIAAIVTLLLSVPVFAQVKQSGSVTPGHPAAWVTNGVIGDGGTAAQGNLTSLGVTASGPGICQNSGPISGAYNQICLTTTQTGGGGLSLNSYGGATGGFTLTYNGGTPSSLGNVTGPASSTSGDLPTFNNATGTLLADSGILATSVLRSITANSTPTSGFGAGTLAYSDGSLIQASSGIVVAGVGQLALTLGTITTNQDALNITATWNNAGTTFDAPIYESITNTASAAGSKIIDLQVGGFSLFALDVNGALSGNPYIKWNGATGVTIQASAGVLNVDGPIFASGQITATLANTATTSAMCYNTSSGVFTYDGTLGTCNTSDERLKTFDHLPFGDALGKLVSLSESAHFGYFHWNDPAQYGAGERIGAGAQTVASLYPELTETGSNGYMSLAYDKLTVPIIQSLREIVDSCRAAANDNFCQQLLKKVNAR